MRTRIFGLMLMLFFPSLVMADFKSAKDFEEDSSPLKAVVFLSPDCPCSRSHVEHLNQIVKEYPNLKLYGLISEPAEGDSKLRNNEYFSEKNFAFPIIDDPKQVLVKKYGALKTPHVSLLKKKANGSFETLYEGGVTDGKEFEPGSVKFLEENLKLVSQAKDVKYKNGRSLGCYIRRI